MDSWHGIILGRRTLPMPFLCHPCCGKAVTCLTNHPLHRSYACAEDTSQLLIISHHDGWLCLCAHTHKAHASRQHNWHAISSLIMKSPSCLRLLNLKLNSTSAAADCRAGHGVAAEQITAQHSRHLRLLLTPISCCHQTHSRSPHFLGMKTF